MPELDALARAALAVVFGAAGLAKLLTRPDPARLAGTVGLGRRALPAVRALPAIELLVATGLVWAVTSRWAATAAGALLIVFSGLLVRARKRGLNGGCNCFGALSRAPRGRAGRGWPLLRNLVLLVVAATVALGHHQPPLGAAWAGLAQWDGPELLAVSLVALGLVVGVALWVSRWDRRRAQRAPRILDLTVRTLEGTQVPLSLLARGENATLVFVDPDCGPCQSVLAALPAKLAGRAEGWPLLAVTRGDPKKNSELFAGSPPDRVLLDDGSLLAASAVGATPSVVVVSRGRLRSAATGAQAVLSALGVTVEGARRSGPRSAFFQGLWTRREALRTGLAAAGVFVVAPPLGPGARLAAAAARPKAAGVNCPSCGSCVICEEPPAGTTTFKCRACAKKCTAHQLCTGYANQLPGYRMLAGYLARQGYTQVGTPVAGGLDANGKLAYLSLMTAFASKSARAPKAVLVYGLANNGESAQLALLNAANRVTSVIAPGENGELFGVSVPPAPSVPSRAGEGLVADGARLDMASCAATCKQMWDTVLMGVTQAFSVMEDISPVLEEAELVTPAGWGFALGSFLMTQVLLPPLIDATLGPVEGKVVKLGLLGKLINVGLDKLAGKTSMDKLEDQVGSLLCSNLVCKVQLKACCNYTGACYDSDALCESKCPGGLAHPLAHCDVYINGVKVSTLVP
jgi:hypothetical protein